jgi:hypothetical protein
MMPKSFRLWARQSVVTLAALTFTLSVSHPAEAVPLVRGLGGPAGYGANFLDYNDDGSSPEINVAAAFPFGLRFFGAVFRTLYVNNNGNITFGGDLASFTPDPFPVADQRMIAPWWGDVDTRGGGRPAMNGVWWDIRPGQFTVTWDHVGYFASHDDLQNSFQLILRPSPSCGNGDFDVEFRYERCEWTAGDASGGVDGLCDGLDPDCTPAQAGFDAGDNLNFFTLPMSRTNAVVRLCTTSNVGEPGVWRFQIRGGELPCNGSGSACVTGYPGACGAGTIQCRSGRPVCLPDNLPRQERCDGVDNDCDGLTDENDMLPPGPLGIPDGGLADGAVNPGGPDGAAGDGGARVALCPRAGDVCARGVCVPGCVEGACFADQTCTPEMVCVETNCLRVNCPPGQTCRAGMCEDACAGVQCPQPLSCRFGRCLNLCEGVTCDMGQVCREGRCVAGCQCAPCAMGLACQPTGECIAPRCVDVMCARNEYCDVRGRCVNTCDEMGVSCPRGQHCERGSGQCVDDGAMMVPDVATSDAVTDVPSASSDTPQTGSPDAGRMDGSAQPATDGSVPDPFLRRGGCACRTSTAPTHDAHFAAVFAAVIASLWRRNRRRTTGARAR